MMEKLKQGQISGNQRIRGPKLIRLSRYGLPFEEGLAMANAGNYVIASNKRLNQALVRNKEWDIIKAVFNIWTGTMTAYVKPGEKLGKTVEYVDPETGFRWVFPVPQEHQDKKDAILVTEHPDYNLEVDKKTRIVRAAKVDLIEKFPASLYLGWYLCDAQHDIPTGDEVGDRNSRAKRLWRMDKRVGPIVRGDDDFGYDRRGLRLYHGPSNAFTVVVEAPESIDDSAKEVKK